MGLIQMRRAATTQHAFQMVARVLSQRAGVTVKFEGRPCTDGKVIYLPLPTTPRRGWNMEKELTLAWGFLDHEVGHVRETNNAQWANAVQGATARLRHLVNIVEDVRMEAIMGATFAGAAQNLRKVTELLVETGDFCFAPANAPFEARASGYVLHALRASILNQDALAPLAASDRATLDPAFLAKLDPLLQWDARSWPKDTEAAARIAQRIDALIAEASTQAPQQGKAQTDGAQAPQQGKAQTDGAQAPQQGKAQTDGAQAPQQGQASTWVHPVLAAEGDLGKLLGQHLMEGTAVPPPRWSSTPEVAPNWRVTDPALARRLGAKLGQRIGDTLQTATIARARRGLKGPVMDLAQLHRIGVGDGRIFRARTQARQPDTAVAIALDLSGSMYGAWNDAATAAVATLHGMKAIKGVKVGLYAFPMLKWLARIGAPLPMALRAGDIPRAAGGTPLAHALSDCATELISRHEPRKVCVCVTDGEGSGDYVGAINAMRGLGIQTIGIGMGCAKALPMDSWEHLKDVTQLGHALALHLRKVATS